MFGHKVKKFPLNLKNLCVSKYVLKKKKKDLFQSFTE